MYLPDNYFRDLSPADIVSKVASITLTEISRLSAETLLRIGWLNNPIIDILYSMTSAGVWIANTDTSGQKLVSEANSADIKATVSEHRYNDRLTQSRPLVSTSPATYGAQANAQPKIRVVTITSDAAGNLAADVILVDKIASYFGVCYIRSFLPADTGAATTPSLVVQDDGGALNKTLVGSSSGSGVPVVDWKDIPLYGSVDNEDIFLDTGSSGLGNTKTWYVVVEYWYET